MGVPFPDIDTVTRLLDSVSQEIILPRFRQLTTDEVERKHSLTDPDDVVTVVDRAVEAALTSALLDLAPGSAVVGEEATHSAPNLLQLLDTDTPLWLIDPIDGTKNFIAGSDGFGTMLAYVVAGQTRAAWILLPVRDEMFVAEKGSGAWLRGTRLYTQPPGTHARPRGTLHVRYMPAPIRDTVTPAVREECEVRTDSRSAAIEYTDVLQGRRDFAVYYRLLPWDHAAPALFITEGGGCVEHLDGTPYVPRSEDQVTIVGADAPTTARVRAWFLPGQPAAGVSA